MTLSQKERNGLPLGQVPSTSFRRLMGNLWAPFLTAA